MGSGESDATAGSNNDNAKGMPAIIPGGPKLRNPSTTSKKQAELERPIQPALIANNMSSSDEEEEEEEEDPCEDDDDEDWMFKTFTGKKALANNQPSKDSSAAPSNLIRAAQ